MKYLLDTHTAIWALSDTAKLSEAARSIIEDVSASICVSIVSAWEIAIKINIGKLDFRGGSESFIEKMKYYGAEIYELRLPHIKYIESLPLIHRDPFDRILVAVAKVENLTILTADGNIHKYEVSWIW